MFNQVFETQIKHTFIFCSLSISFGFVDMGMIHLKSQHPLFMFSLQYWAPTVMSHQDSSSMFRYSIFKCICQLQQMVQICLKLFILPSKIFILEVLDIGNVFIT